MAVSTISVSGKSIIHVDCANISMKNKGEIISLLQQASKMVASRPAKSVLIITDLTNLGFDTEVFEAFKQYAASNTPYVKASALVGLSGLQKIMFNTVKKLTGRDYYVASSLDDAKAFLLRA